jgi:hypothetical protein
VNNDDFLAKCRSLDPSVGIDHEKNREIIRTRIKNEEQIDMMKNKRVRRPVMAAAVLAAVLSLSVVAYAAVPAIWRLIDANVLQGEEFVPNLQLVETENANGTVSQSVQGITPFDFEAYIAAGGGEITVEVNGEPQVLLDEINFNTLEDLKNTLRTLDEGILLPTSLPEGFTFSKAHYPINPLIHDVPASWYLKIEYTNGNDII